MSTLNDRQAEALFLAAPTRHIDVGAGEVAYRRVGQGPDVLFVHGWPVSGATFRGLLPHLAPHVTCHVLDLVGAGQSRFDRRVELSVAGHAAALRRVIDALGLERFAVVGHDSGGLIARHAVAGDPRLRAMALVNTEQPQGLSARFQLFLAMRHLPGFVHLLAWLVMRPRLRRSRFVLGDCFEDDALLEGAFESFFLAPLRDDLERRWAASQLLERFDARDVAALAALHARIDAPVRLVWGERDPFFPVRWAQEMVGSFPNASLQVIPRAKLFVHEERPAEVAAAILPTLLHA
jgi:pimeloyl-ACP methyl ester carboxylesterase